jgi:hypothetical protein
MIGCGHLVIQISDNNFETKDVIKIFQIQANKAVAQSNLVFPFSFLFAYFYHEGNQ